MATMRLLLVFCAIMLAVYGLRDEDPAHYINRIEPEYQARMTQDKWADYYYNTHLSAENKEKSLLAHVELSMFESELAKNVSDYFDISDETDPATKRKIELLKVKYFPLSEEDNREYAAAVADMIGTYSSYKVCAINSPDCAVQWALEPDLSKIMAESRNTTELKYAWEQWHAEGRAVVDNFTKYVRLGNKGLREAGTFKNRAEQWKFDYEQDQFAFQDRLEDLWRQVLPLYEQLHAYVLRQLKQIYPEAFADNQHTIPAHLMGNMWAHSWSNIISIIKPYPNVNSIDITKDLLDQGYTVRKVFDTAVNFFVSLGMPNLPESFWEISMLEKPTDHDAVCHASAWNFYNKKDFAIKMCTVLNYDNFLTVHHELGHVYYYLNYLNQSVFFQNGANPGFHEAVGDTIYLSATTPTYLKQIGLLTDYNLSKEEHINTLFQNSLNFVTFLPYGYMLDLWRYKVFDGSVTRENYNPAFWDLRFQYQGITPPSPRGRDEFDPGAKFHVVANAEYIRYYVARFLVFQFHEAMCNIIDPSRPLSQCSIFGSKEAGKKLMEMLSYGNSIPWPKVLETLTGAARLTAKPMLDFFQPLYDWLNEENQKANACFGWGYHWPENYELPQPRC